MANALKAPSLQNIHDWAAAGLTRQEIAWKSGMSRITLNKLFKEDKRLELKYLEGRGFGIGTVKQSLYETAQGSDKVAIIAKIFYLKNTASWADLSPTDRLRELTDFIAETDQKNFLKQACNIETKVSNGEITAAEGRVLMEMLERKSTIHRNAMTEELLKRVDLLEQEQDKKAKKGKK